MKLIKENQRRIERKHKMKMDRRGKVGQKKNNS